MEVLNQWEGGGGGGSRSGIRKNPDTVTAAFCRASFRRVRARKSQLVLQNVGKVSDRETRFVSPNCG